MQSKKDTLIPWFGNECAQTVGAKPALQISLLFLLPRGDPQFRQSQKPFFTLFIITYNVYFVKRTFENFREKK